jgi:CubicO group peptidase (beta-lactamase class C family)
MRKYLVKRRLLLFVASTLLASVPTACNRAPSAAPRDPGIDAVAEAYRTTHGIVGLGIGVVVNGEVAYVAGYGLADREAAIPVDPHQTRFRWASISKTLTAVAALSLAEVDALDLDAPVASVYQAYVPPPGVLAPFGQVTPLPDGWHVTVRNLLDHRSGMRHYSNGTPGVSVTPPGSQRNDPTVNTGFAWAFSRWTSEPLRFLPGTGFSYSTPGFNLLGAVVGAAQNARSGLAQSVEEGYLDRVRGLLAGTAAQGVRPDYQWIDVPNRSRGYIADDDTLAISDDGDSDVSWKLPGGGFISTTRELAEYCRLLTGTTLVSASMAADVFTLGPAATPRYNLGFFIDARNNRVRVSHGGVQQKVRSHLAFYPAERLGFVVFSNTSTAEEDEPFWAEWFDSADAPAIQVGQLVDQLEDLVRARVAAGEPAVQTP